MPKKRKYPWYKARECFRVQKSMPDGKVKTLYAKTEEEMDRKLAALNEELAAGVDHAYNPTVAEYAAKWFRLNTVDLSPARVADYRNAINNHIGPVIATKRMKEVTLDDGREIMARLAGKSDSLHANVACVLRKMFQEAEDTAVIVKSPFHRLKAGGKKAQEKTPLSDAQAAQLMAAVHGTAVEPFVALGLYAGLRKEEILGLRWANVHLSGPAPYLSVRERVVYVGGQAVHEAELKSKAARRSIPMPTPLLECLRSYRIRCPHEFVICNPAGGSRSEASFRRLWQMVANRTVGEGEKLGDKVRNHRVVKSLDFHVSPHVLRHTYITNLCKSGMNIKTIQYLAGHATAALTLSIYIHAVNNTPEELAEDVNRAFGVLQKDTKSDTDTSNSVVSIAVQ